MGCEEDTRWRLWLIWMRLTPLKPDSERCNECRRRARYRVGIRNASRVLFCNRCAVRLVVGLVELIATAEPPPHPASRGGGRRKPLIRKL